jgi:Fur family ferric uptake transcriptional regulator
MVARKDKVSHLLSDFGLSETIIRREVLSLLWGEGVALTQKEIEAGLSVSTDRVTLYRNLKLFTEKGVLHKIVLDEETHKYKLAGEFRRSDHAHFYCKHCRKLLCMPGVDVDTSRLPSDFQVYSTRLVIEGICDHCAKAQTPDNKGNMKS